MEKIFDIRFLVPPVVTLFFVFFFSPSHFLELLQGYDQYESLKILTVGSLTILAFGILISSVVHLILVVCLNRRSSNYDLDEIEIISEHFLREEKLDPFNRPKNLDALELASWLIAEHVSDYVKEQINKRWQWAMAGFNLVGAVILAFIIVFFEHCIFQIIPNQTSDWSAFWFSVLLVSTLVFFFNAKYNLDSVREIDRILVRNFKQIAGAKKDLSINKEKAIKENEVNR